MTTTLRESAGTIMRRVFSESAGSVDGLINRRELKRNAMIALGVGAVTGGVAALSALQLALPAYVKDPLLLMVVSTLFSSWIAHLKTINSGDVARLLPPGTPAPATGAVAPADAPSAGEWTGPSAATSFLAPPSSVPRATEPYTDDHGIIWPSREAYLDHSDRSNPPPAPANIPYTDVFTGKEYESYGAYLDAMARGPLPPEA